jgi:hypothetical protein
MKKNRGMILIALALVSLACADVAATKEADFPSGPGMEGKQRGKLEAGEELAQNDTFYERYNVQIFDGKLRPIKHYYLGDSESVTQATKAVANQGKAH